MNDPLSPMRPVRQGDAVPEPKARESPIYFICGGLIGFGLAGTVFLWSSVGLLPLVVACVVVAAVALVRMVFRRARARRTEGSGGT